MQLVTDAAWILTKNSVMEKVVGMMADLSAAYREIWDGAQRRAAVPGHAESIGEGMAIAFDAGSPKISRGENYQGLPWVMLDYPRIFGREDVLAIRTMFWWGHAFIVTLHLKGKYRRMFLPLLERDWEGLAAAGFHLGITEDEWRHEHIGETYRPLTGSADLTGHGLDFLKLSANLGINRWSAATEILSGWFTMLVKTLANYPGDERGLSPGSSRVDSDL